MKINDKLTKDIRDNISNIAGKILWTNPNPTSSITSDTNITLSSDDYDMLEIHFRQNTGDERCYTQRVRKGVNTRIFAPVLSGSNVIIEYRNINRNNDTSYTIASIGPGGESHYIIPTHIVGYKTGLF